MTIRDTDTWEWKDCGCGLQLSLWEREDDDEPDDPLEMWVIRRPCEEHDKIHKALADIADKVMDGIELTGAEMEYATEHNMYSVDVAVDDEE